MVATPATPTSQTSKSVKRFPSWPIWIFLLIAIILYPLQTYRRPKSTHSIDELQRKYGNWAIVAGASEGLGAAWAELLCHQHGINVLLIARRSDALQALQHKLLLASKDNPSSSCAEVDIWVQDLTDPNLEEAFATLLQEHSSRNYGLLVHNAAAVAEGRFLDRSVADQQNVVQCNIQSVVTMTHLFGTMRRGYHNNRRETNQEGVHDRIVGGGIILMSSLAGLTGHSTLSNYAATKAWTLQFAHGLYREWKQADGEGMDILACVAGATRTPNYQQLMKAVYSDGGDLKTPSLDFGVQLPMEVAEECLYALGKVPSLATGPFNKVTRFLLSRLLPAHISLEIMGSEGEKRMADN